MKKYWKSMTWLLGTIIGSAIFALGFALFLEPYGMSPGGISGLSMVLVHLLEVGSVGTLSILINLPLFLLGGLKIGKRFFIGSLVGMLLSSVLIDLFATLQVPEVEPLVGVLYGGGLCGFGLGIVFVVGSSTGGSDILVRLLKLRWRNVPIGQIALCFDALVVILTGIVYNNMTSSLYTGLAVFVTSQVVDMVVYRFDFSFVKAFYIFSDIFFVVFEKLLLNSKCTTEILVVYECLDNFRHTADCNIITEEFEKFIRLQSGKRFDFLHV
jgi:uncharacterized membrane-anchored protein YitT (DUF2179 family)